MAELLSTFAAPSREEIVIVRKRMAQIAATMSQMDNEIERVEKILTSLRYDRATLPKLHDRYHNVLNLTRRLPFEILGEIFIQTQDMSPGGTSIAPTRVCHHWREVAIVSSKLWSNRVIEYRGYWPREEAEMIPIWLQRSSGQPLKIDVGRDTYEDRTYKGNPSLDAMIHNQSHRWKQVKLVINETTLSFLKNIPEDLPMLYSLYIAADRIKPVIIDTALKNFRNAHGLRVLTLGQSISPVMPEFPWAHLITCTLVMGSGLCTFADSQFVLSQAVNLRSYQMEFDPRTGFSLVAPPPTAIHHVNLLSLEMTNVTGVNAKELFELLTLPVLNELKVEQRHTFATYSAPETITSLITRSGCSLIRLYLKTGDTPCTRDELLNLFTATPMLAELELQSGAAVGVDDVLMHLLTHFPNHDAGPCCLLPQLTSIKCSVHSEFSYETFARLLASRLYDEHNCTLGRVPPNGLAQIRTASLVPWGRTSASGRHAQYLPEETLQNMVALRNSGLDFYVRWSGNACALEEYFSPGEEEDDWESEPENEDEDEDEDEEEEDDEDEDEYEDE